MRVLTSLETDTTFTPLYQNFGLGLDGATRVLKPAARKLVVEARVLLATNATLARKACLDLTLYIDRPSIAIDSRLVDPIFMID